MPSVKILITGAHGQLGREMVRQWQDRHELLAVDYADLDITDFATVRVAIDGFQPELVVNCAAYNAVDKAETEIDAAFRINALGPKNLAIATESDGIPLVHFSTDFVFNGPDGWEHTEYDPISPQCVYARSKAAGEEVVRQHTNKFFIIRVSWLAGLGGPNFVETMLRLGAEQDVLSVVNDQTGSPTFCFDVVPVAEQLAYSGQFGTYHVTGNGPTTWHDFAVEIFRQAKLNQIELAIQDVLTISTEEYNQPAQRPSNSYLRNLMTELVLGADPMPDWRESLERYLSERPAKA
jgi:dTDP-4-dehydrorhamnose reductase